LNKYRRDYIILILIAGFIIALDQWTKTMVRNNLALGETWAPWDWLYPYVHIVNWWNTGAAFGIFQQGSLVFTVLAFVVIGLIMYYYPRIPAAEWSLRLALGMQLGGAFGNLIDRLTQRGRVTDFIRMGDFPIFNVADAGISVGVAVLILGMWITEKQKQKGNPVAEVSMVPELPVSLTTEDPKDE
jgi:signal peptidase II